MAEAQGSRTIFDSFLIRLGSDCNHDDGLVGVVYWSTTAENTSGRLCYSQKLVEGFRRPTFSELSLDFTGYSTGHSSFDPQWCPFLGSKKEMADR